MTVEDHAASNQYDIYGFARNGTHTEVI